MDLSDFPDIVLQPYNRVTTLFLMVQQDLEIFKTGPLSHFHDSHLYFQFSTPSRVVDLHNESDK